MELPQDKKDKIRELRELNWNSDTCPCEVEPRLYIIGKEPPRIIRGGPVPRYEPEKVWCQLHRLDGSVTDIPMRVTTVWEMAKSGQQPEYWADSQRRQLEQIAKTEALMADLHVPGAPKDRADPAWLARLGQVYPQEKDLAKLAASLPAPDDPAGWERLLAQANYAKTYVDHEGYRRSPGTQLRGHLSHRCPKHDNVTSQSIWRMRGRFTCGCLAHVFVVGEIGEHGTNHLQWIEFCPRHEAEGPPEVDLGGGRS